MADGPICLVDDVLAVVALCPAALVYERILSNVQEVKARSGRVIAPAARGDEGLRALLDGRRDVDQRRNLAQSVTVESGGTRAA